MQLNPPAGPLNAGFIPGAFVSPPSLFAAASADGSGFVVAGARDVGAGAALASARRGLIKHGEHMADLVLDIVPGAESGELPGFEQFASFVRQLTNQIRARAISVLNEKFDGSPAIVLGFDGGGAPYVAYKHGIERSDAARLVRSREEAREIFGDGAMGGIFADCIEFLGPRMAGFEDKDLVFQADLLFAPGNGAKVVDADAVRIRANPFGIEYVLPAGSKFYKFAESASLGLVVHTIGRRVIDASTGAVTEVLPLDDPRKIEELVRMLKSEDVFAIDPWSRHVEIDSDPEKSFTAAKSGEVEAILEEMRSGLGALGAEFRLEWKRFLPLFKIFLNESLKEGGSGGVYKAAAEGEEFDFEKLAGAFCAWVKARSERFSVSYKGAKKWMAPKKMPAELDAFIARHRDELQKYFRAYFDANRIQYILKPHMAEAYRSKLGGGRIEGIMITDEATQVRVKLVDRLDFTRQNFAGEGQRKILGKRRRARAAKTAAEGSEAEAAFPRWRQGLAFFVGKLEPPHAGHIALIGAAVAYFGAPNVFVVPSFKEPDFSAEDWRGLGAAARKADLAAGRFVHAFSRAIREEMLRFGLPEGVQILFAEPGAFWGHIKSAQDNRKKGKAFLVVGEKEMREGRYRQQFSRFRNKLAPASFEMQRGGISATEVRRAIQSLHEKGDIGSYRFLVEAFDYIPAAERDRIIGRLLKEWGDVAQAVKALV